MKVHKSKKTSKSVLIYTSILMPLSIVILLFTTILLLTTENMTFYYVGLVIVLIFIIVLFKSAIHFIKATKSPEDLIRVEGNIVIFFTGFGVKKFLISKIQHFYFKHYRGIYTLMIKTDDATWYKIKHYYEHNDLVEFERYLLNNIKNNEKGNE